MILVIQSMELCISKNKEQLALLSFSLCDDVALLILYLDIMMIDFINSSQWQAVKASFAYRKKCLFQKIYPLKIQEFVKNSEEQRSPKIICFYNKEALVTKITNCRIWNQVIFISDPEFKYYVSSSHSYVIMDFFHSLFDPECGRQLHNILIIGLLIKIFLPAALATSALLSIWSKVQTYTLYTL